MAINKQALKDQHTTFLDIDLLRAKHKPRPQDKEPSIPSAAQINNYKKFIDALPADAQEPDRVDVTHKGDYILWWMNGHRQWGTVIRTDTIHAVNIKTILQEKLP